MNFSRRSIDNLNSCHYALQLVAYQAIRKDRFDFTVICGHRNEEDQNKAYDEGYSRLKYPDSKHNHSPSYAIDFIPYPFNGWEEKERFKEIGKLLKDTANELRNMGMIRRSPSYGGDWRKWKDYQHFELY